MLTLLETNERITIPGDNIYGILENLKYIGVDESSGNAEYHLWTRKLNSSVIDLIIED